MWEAMLLEEGDVELTVRSTCRHRPEEPDMQEYINRQLEREGYDAQGNRLENLPND